MELFSVLCVKGRWLLEDDVHKQIVADSLAFLVKERRIWLFGYVILPYEMHLLWQKQPAWERRNIRQMLLKFTAQQIKHRLKALDRKSLESYRTSLGDRQYQFWERRAEIRQVSHVNDAIEKLRAMHEVPVAAGLCTTANEYRFSSAMFYGPGISVAEHGSCTAKKNEVAYGEHNRFRRYRAWQHGCTTRCLADPFRSVLVALIAPPGCPGTPVSWYKPDVYPVRQARAFL